MPHHGSPRRYLWRMLALAAFSAAISSPTASLDLDSFCCSHLPNPAGTAWLLKKHISVGFHWPRFLTWDETQEHRADRPRMRTHVPRSPSLVLSCWVGSAWHTYTQVLLSWAAMLPGDLRSCQAEHHRARDRESWVLAGIAELFI